MPTIPLLPGTPLYGGSVSSSEVPSRFPAALAGRGMYVDLDKYERTTLPLLREATDQSTEPGEQSRSSEGVWIRSGRDWSLGAGQTYYDRAESERRRFRTSKGFDVWTEGTGRLLPDVEQVDASVATNNDLLTAGAYLYKIEGATLAYSSTGASGSWTAVTLTGVGATLLTMTTDGVYVYVGDGANVWRCTIGSAGAFAAWSTYNATGLWFCNGRLIAANLNELTELDAAGAALGTPLSTRTAGFEWKSAVGGLTAIYATCTAGNVSEVYYITVDASTGALESPAIATPWIRGETINVLDFYGGFIFFGTSLGYRLGTISANTISYGQLTEIDGGVHSFAFENRYGWASWSDFDSDSTGLVRIDLGQPVDAELLVFAYASDLMVTGQGDVLAVERFGAETYLAVSGLGFYRETDDRVSEGKLYPGWVTYNDVEDKIALAVNVRHEPLAGEINVQLRLIDETLVDCGSSRVQTSTKPVARLSAGETAAERVEPVIIATRSATDSTEGPVLLLWQLLSLPTGLRTEELLVPFIVDVDVYGESFNPAEVFSWLKGLEADRRPVVYQQGTTSYSVVVDRVGVDPDSWASYDDDVDHAGLFYVRMLTLEV